MTLPFDPTPQHPVAVEGSPTRSLGVTRVDSTPESPNGGDTDMLYHHVSDSFDSLSTTPVGNRSAS